MSDLVELLRSISAEQAFEELYQACWEYFAERDVDPLSDIASEDSFRPIRILYALACAHTEREALAEEERLSLQQDLPYFHLEEQMDFSALYLALGKYAEAESLLMQLQNLNHVSAVVLARLAFCKIKVEQPEEAYDLFHQALVLEPQRVEIRLNLCALILEHFVTTGKSLGGEIEIHQVASLLDRAESDLAEQQNSSVDWQQRMFVQIHSLRLEYWIVTHQVAHAEAWVASLVKEQGIYIDALVSLADLLHTQGRFYQAEANLLNGLRRYPDNITLFSALVRLCQVKQREVDGAYYYRKLEQYSVQPDQALLQSVNLFNGVVRHQNQSELANNTYEETLISRLRARFTPHFIDRFSESNNLMSENSDSSICPVFLLGMPSAGVSLLSDYLRTLDGVLSLGASCQVPVLQAGLEIKEREKGSTRAYPDILDSISHNQWRGLSEGLRSFYHAKAPSAKTVLDTNPDNVFHLGLIKLLLPKAKFVVLKRNPKGLLHSATLQQKIGAFCQPEAFANWVGGRIKEHNALLFHWKRLWPESILEVSFDDMMTDSNQSLHTLHEFLPELSIKDSFDLPSRWLAAKEAYIVPPKSNSPAILQTMLLAMQPKAEEVNDMVTLVSSSLFTQAYQALQTQEYRQGEILCKKILSQLPNYAPAYYLLSELYIRAGLLNKGLESIQKALSLAPWKAYQWQQDLARAQNLYNQETAKVAYEEQLTREKKKGGV
ncbi:MAG: sulfotransferase [Marinomonas sp.]